MAKLPIWIDDIKLETLSTTTLAIQTNVVETQIPGGIGQATVDGVVAPTFSLDCKADSASAAQALREMRSNPDCKWNYIRFPGTENWHDGFYSLTNIETPRAPGLGFYPVRLQVSKIASGCDARVATLKWTSACETASGFSSPSMVQFISLPNGASNFDFASACRTTSDGIAPFMVNPTRSLNTYVSSASISEWFKSNCRIYDTASAGNLTETSWVQVYGKDHNWAGDWVFQNGLIRYIFSASVGTWYVWDNITSPSAWSRFGVPTMNLSASDGTSPSTAKILHTELQNYTAEWIRWREIWGVGSNVAQINYTLRRGAYHTRCLLKTQANGINSASGLRLWSGSTSASYFKTIFNTAASGTSASGSLPAQSVDNWFAGFSSSRNWVAGFTMMDNSASQPYDSGSSDSLCETNVWGSSASRLFFVFAFPYNTTTCGVVNARPIAASIAAQCGYNINQLLVPADRGFYPF